MKKLKNLILVALVFFVGLGFCACKDTGNSGNNSGGNNAGNTKQTYTITYQDTKGLTNENPTTYTEDTETIILKDLENTDDYEFLGWYNGETKVTEITKGSKGNLTLTPKWKEIIRELAYKLSEDGTYYIVTGMGECNVSDIVIPDTYNGLPVKEIGKSAFAGNFTIASVVIGNNVTSIGENAFDICWNLTSVTIGKNVKNIPDQLFSNCFLLELYNLSRLDMKNENYGVSEIDVYTSLDEPSKLKTSNGMIYYVNDDEKIAMKPVDVFSPSVIVEEDCTEISKSAFNKCFWLTEIYNLSSIDIESVILNSEGLYMLPIRNDDGDIFIKKSLDEPSKLKTSNGMIYYVTDKEKIAIRPETIIGLDRDNECLVLDKEEIVIDDDCTRIGFGAFLQCNLKNITLPNSLTSIGSYAFYYSSLTNIMIPDSVTNIGYLAFYNCSKLTSVTIGNGVTDINDETFSCCTSLQYNIYDNVKYLGNNENPYLVLMEVTDKNITAFSISKNVKIIYSNAFSDCRNLTSIIIPNSVTSIGDSAFYNCNSLKYNTYDNAKYLGNNENPYLVLVEAINEDITTCTININTKIIYSNAFSDCRNLTSIIIPDSVTSIGYCAFYGCSSLTGITIPNSVISIGDSVFVGCYRLIEIYNLSSLKIPKSKNSKVYDDVEYIVKDVYTRLDEPSKLKTSNGVIYYINGAEKIAVAPEDMNVTNIILDNDCTEINQGAFCECSSLTSITIPNSVTSIGDYAFSGCSNLISIAIPNSVISIGDSVFSGCRNLTSVTIGNNVTSIGDYVFSGCRSLTSVTIGNSVTSIGYSAFYGCSSLIEVIIPNSVTSIGDSAFRDCSGLTSITIPNSVTSIGDSAFRDCSSLTSVYYTGIIENWCNITFSDSNSNPMYYALHFYIKNSNGEYEELTKIEIPNTVTKINDYAFYRFRNITKVTIPNSVTSIGEYAFYKCISLTSVSIGNNVTSIGDYAFGDCSKLTSVTIGNSVTSIGVCAFVYCSSLTSITIPNSVTSIGNQAFYDCSSLTSVTIGNNVTSIGVCVFSSRNLTKVYYNGTSSDWDKISIGSDNSSLKKATRYYYSETKPTVSGNYWHYDTDGTTILEW